MRLTGHGLSLTTGAEVAGTLCLTELPDRRGALAAWRLNAAVNTQLLGKIPRATVATHEITECGPTRRDRLRKDVTNRADQMLLAYPSDAPRRAGGMNAGTKQRFVRIDAAHPHDHTGIHTHAASARCYGLMRRSRSTR